MYVTYSFGVARMAWRRRLHDDAVYGDDVHQLIFLRLAHCCSLYEG